MVVVTNTFMSFEIVRGAVEAIMTKLWDPVDSISACVVVP